MPQNAYMPDSANAIAQYFDNASLPSQQETLGRIVVEILTSGNTLNRKSICTKLLSRLEQASNADEESHYQHLIGLLFEK